ncbi:hypothetical protein ACIU1J_29235 [Azospirillum doebereinerae]|uniref:hypothetical protein n=1 Tax=Azospirillum doebereinerae TaxID=92933 RepID=UPI00384CCEB6
MDDDAVDSTLTLTAEDAAALLGRLDEPARLWPALLDLIARRLPCDACALLRHDGDRLVPLATRGLSPDTLGRRFRLEEHPPAEGHRRIRGSAAALSRRLPAARPL